MKTNLTDKLSKFIVEKVAIIGAAPGGLAAAIAPGIVETLKSLEPEVHHTVLNNIQGKT